MRPGRFRWEVAAASGLLLVAVAAGLYAFLGNTPEETVRQNPPEPLSTPAPQEPLPLAPAPRLVSGLRPVPQPVAQLHEALPTAPAPRPGPPVVTILADGRLLAGGDVFP